MSKAAKVGQAIAQGAKQIVNKVFVPAGKEAGKEVGKGAAEYLFKPDTGMAMDVDVHPPAAPMFVPLAAPPPPPPVQFPALCYCKYELHSPHLGNGYYNYICDACTRAGMGEYRTVIEGRRFADLKGGKKKTVKRRRSQRSRLHLTKRMRVRHNSKNGRSRR
jgi:hypothetical protein